MADRCLLCERLREPESELCGLHNAALHNLENTYSSWNKAFGGSLTKEDYYTKLEELSETGRAVKDLIQHLRGKRH